MLFYPSCDTRSNARLREGRFSRSSPSRYYSTRCHITLSRPLVRPSSQVLHFHTSGSRESSPSNHFFLNFTAILIAAGAMSEEYEQGTAELLLSKPVERNDYFAGKFLGGYTLFLTILAFNIILSVASAFTFFGTQFGLAILPGLFLVQAFAALIFYSLAFMLGELVRRSSLAYIFSSAVFFSSFIISAYMDLIYTLTGKTIYKTIQIYLPTSPANSLPIQYASPLLPQTVGIVLQFVGSGTAIVPSLDLSVAILLAYTVPAIAIAAAYFWFADISRKMS